MNPRSSESAAIVAADIAEARFGLRIAAMLNEQSERLAPDVQTRLQFARQQALQQRQRRAAAPAVAGSVRFGNALSLVGGDGPRWLRWLSLVPLLMLVGGLFLIQYQHGQTQIEVAADIDAALLGGDLPPAAYRDAGFVEYLKAPRN